MTKTDPATFCLATTLADRAGDLVPKIAPTWPALTERFASVVVHATEATHAGWFAHFDAAGVPCRTAPSDPAAIGLHRRRSLEMALETGADRIFYADLDHAMRWVERAPDDLDRVLAHSPGYDCLIVGRSDAAFAAAPRRLRDTEHVANHIYELLTGRAGDLMMAARCFSRDAARRVVTYCDEDTIGNDLAWPLCCEAGGFTVGYAPSDGLLYETNEVYGTGGVDERDDDPAAWMDRVDYLAQQVAAMRPYLESFGR